MLERHGPHRSSGAERSGFHTGRRPFGKKSYRAHETEHDREEASEDDISQYVNRDEQDQSSPEASSREVGPEELSVYLQDNDALGRCSIHSLPN